MFRVIFLTVAFRLGEVVDPRAKLYMILYGRKGESGKIYLASPDGKKFEPGRLYTVSANIRDIGPVSSFNSSVNCTRVCMKASLTL